MMMNGGKSRDNVQGVSMQDLQVYIYLLECTLMPSTIVAYDLNCHCCSHTECSVDNVFSTRLLCKLTIVNKNVT